MLWLFPILLSIACVRADVSAFLKAGMVQGTSYPESAVNSFLGIPSYPGGTLNATASKAICVQFGSTTQPGSSSTAAPSQTEEPRTPLYSGCELASDAIVVTIGYRNGPLGVLALEGTAIPGNQAVKDCLMGAQWVQANIAAFGGDPRQVLIFGEFSGAAITWIMSTMSSAPSLMKAAIAESGAGSGIQDNSSYYAQGQEYAKAVGCNTTDELNSAQPVVPVFTLNSPGFRPFVDGDFIPVQPQTVPVKVPLLFGTNADEGTVFTLGGYGSPAAMLV
ncbi:hypothetical protein MMC12_004365 [Toensbergia leucococca]|nr:hypothetical protein [Toensbergia leucococca]